MRRRDFIAGLGGTAAWPFAVRAQQRATPVIGFLHSESLESRRDSVTAFHRGLAESGYVEGRNAAIEYRWAEGRYDRLPAMALDLARRQVAMLTSPSNTAAALAAKAATQTIPIVFLTGSDPVQVGLVASLNRPGGNLTGVSLLNTDIAAKRVELLHELVPTATLIAFLINPTNAVFAENETREFQRAARILGLRVLVLNASNRNEIETAFETLARQQAGALVVSGEAFYLSQRDELAWLATRHAVPMIS